MPNCFTAYQPNTRFKVETSDSLNLVVHAVDNVYSADANFLTIGHRLSGIE